MSDTLVDPRAGLPSASKLERIVFCPGSQNLENQVASHVEEKPDEDADRGTRIHKARETGSTFELNAEEMDVYEQGLAFEDLLIAQWCADKDIQKFTPGPTEQRLWLHHPETLAPIASGQPDVIYLSPPHALCIDWKAGRAVHVPPARSSWQLRLQALLIHEDMDGLTDIRVAYDRAMSKVGANDYADYTLSDLQNAKQSVLFHLWEAGQPDAPRRPGHWCHFCPGKAWCAESAAYSLLPGVIAQKASVGSTDPKDMVLALTHADLLKIWTASGTVKKILEAVKERLEVLSKAELSELGLELPEQGKRRDTIVNVKAAFSFLAATENWPEEELWKALTLNKGVVAEVAQRLNGLDAKHAVKWTEEILGPWIDRSHDKPSLRRLK